MSKKLSEIPIVVESGRKYVNDVGVKAIKDGVRSTVNQQIGAIPKPAWMKIKPATSEKVKKIKSMMQEHKLSTVCEEAKCPNLNECWSHGTATIMVMGSVCTRACKFCAVDTGNPKGWLDKDEPEKSAQTVAVMDLDYVVITSVDRDDLPDGGAEHFAQTVRAIKQHSPKTKVEVLTPDFKGQTSAVNLLVEAGIDVFAQNIETVERLTHPVRDPKAGYQQTLDMLQYSKKTFPNIYTKTSIMLGLGEEKEEVLQCMQDCRDHGVDIFTLGQYLRPTPNHLPIIRYVPPEEFQFYRDEGLKMGFVEVVSGPLVRSSYRAERALMKDNAGVDLS
jgi:lipoic acid synthetase